MKTDKTGIQILFSSVILVSLVTVFCCRGSSKTGRAAAGLAAPETVEGFPSYANSILASVIHDVDGAILEQEKIIRALSTLPQVKSAKWDDMKDIVTVIQESWKDSGVYWFAFPDGRYFTVEKGLMDATIRDRPYFPKVMRGDAVVGDLVVSKSTGRKSTIVAMPVFDARGKVIGALGATLFLDKLSGTLAASLDLPEGTLFYALGPDGTTALHMKLDLVFDNPLEKDSPSLKAAAEKMLSTDSGEVEYSYNGYEKRVRYAASKLTHWRFAFGMNTGKE
jgi:hypothetical protein